MKVKHLYLHSGIEYLLVTVAFYARLQKGLKMRKKKERAGRLKQSSCAYNKNMFVYFPPVWPRRSLPHTDCAQNSSPHSTTMTTA